MADDVARLHPRDDAVVHVQVGSTNGTGRDANNGVSAILDLRVWHALAADVALAVPSQRFHRRSSIKILKWVTLSECAAGMHVPEQIV
ncbi:hypothetical protein CHELA20_53355 [Hyphomicrobiales bacterium]|nr:hypothetical protein CHELA41_21571 [Hyphomicrobiales bacterium]CAH1684084.1 hypothetical protein CHELA20_53355 [Hyphomicrobiales bacterium]